MRAWHCHGRNQRELVDRLRQAKIVTSPQVQQVMNLVDRQYYVPNNSAGGGGGGPYMDAPQHIGAGQTISAPHMHAHVLEEILPHLLAKPSPAVKILDVGCGSGYLTACFGKWLQPRGGSGTSGSGGEQGGDTNPAGAATAGAGANTILGKTGQAFGIDILDHLVDLTKRNMMSAGGDDGELLTSNIVKLRVANGWNGLPDEAPFDAIHVGAAAAEFPQKLASQLSVGGVLIVPVGPTAGVQTLYKVERLADSASASASGGGANAETTATTTTSAANTAAPRQFVQSDYRITELLWVRYVPLVQGPSSNNRDQQQQPQQPQT